MLDEIPASAAPPLPPSRSGAALARLAVLVIGIGLPYLARIPGVFWRGPGWLTSYTDSGIVGFLLIGVFNAITWVSILLVTCRFRSAAAILVAAAIGFSVPALGNATLDLASDAQASIAVIGFPFMSLPMVLIGWLVGLVIDRKIRRASESERSVDPKV